MASNGIVTALYRTSLKQAALLNERLSRHGVKDWPSFLYLLRRSNSETEMLNLAPEELFKASKEQGYLQQGLPDLSETLRTAYRRGDEKLAFGFSALKMLRRCNDIYKATLEKYATTPLHTLPPAAHRVGAVVVYEGETTVVVGYERDRASLEVTLYHLSCLDGALLEADAGDVKRRDACGVAPAIHDPNAFFVRWDAGARRFLPNRDLAWKYEGVWREEQGLTNESVVADADAPDAREYPLYTAGSRRQDAGLLRVAHAWCVMMYYFLLPGPPLVPWRHVRAYRRTLRSLRAALGRAPQAAAGVVFAPPPPTSSTS